MPEYPGFGDSGRPPWLKRVEDLADSYLDVLEYADRLGFDGVRVNGHHQTTYGLRPT